MQNPAIDFHFEGVNYTVTGDVVLGGVIKLPAPDKRYLAVDTWNKTQPPTPASLRSIGELPLSGGRIWHATRKSQVKRPDTMDPHDRSRNKKARGFPRGIMNVRFKNTTTNERIEQVLTALRALAYVASAKQPFPDGDEQLRTMADVRLNDVQQIDAFLSLLNCNFADDVTGAAEVRPQICDPMGGPRRQSAPLASPAPQSALPASPVADLPGGNAKVTTRFPAGLISVTFKSGTSNATIAKVLKLAKRNLRYVAAAEQPFTKYLKGQDAIRRQAWVNLSDPTKTKLAIKWLLRQPSVRDASEVVLPICW